MNLTTEQLISKAAQLKAGDKILLSGIIYTARDAAHKRFMGLIESGRPLPVDMEKSIIYYCGPAPAKPGSAAGPCGPTTSSRMDKFTPKLLSMGLKASIGKGPRAQEVRDALKEFGAVYLVATGGVAALLSSKVKKSEVVAFEDLGPEAVYKFEVVDFPVIVANDAAG